MKEADLHLQDAARSHQSEAVSSAMEKVSQGIDILNHHQKLIRRDARWRVVMEYEAHSLAENEDDEKMIYRSQRDAERKLRQEREARNTRYSPFSRYGRYFQGQTLTPGTRLQVSFLRRYWQF
jgi:hypothetical protein